MTNDEYRGLVQILERIEARVAAHDARFDEVDQRFTAVDRRLRESGVIAEDLRSQIQLVAEGVANVDEKMDRFRADVARSFEETHALIRLGHADLDRRVRRLEGREPPAE